MATNVIEGNQAGPADQMSRTVALSELQHLSFAFASIIQLIPVGSFERENANNAYNGVRERLKNLHSSFLRLTEEKVAADVARALEPRSAVQAAGQASSGHVMPNSGAAATAAAAAGMGSIVGGLAQIRTDPAILTKLRDAAMNHQKPKVTL